MAAFIKYRSTAAQIGSGDRNRTGVEKAYETSGETSTLPAMAKVAGFEPASYGFGDRYIVRYTMYINLYVLAGKVGIEPTTS